MTTAAPSLPFTPLTVLCEGCRCTDHRGAQPADTTNDVLTTRSKAACMSMVRGSACLWLGCMACAVACGCARGSNEQARHIMCMDSEC